MNGNERLDISLLVQHYDEELLRVMSENLKLKTYLKQKESEIEVYKIQLGKEKEAPEEIIYGEPVLAE